VSNTNNTVLDLKAGTYTVTYELDSALPANAAITLVPAQGSTGTAIPLITTSTQDKYGNPGGTRTIQIAAGQYQVQIDSAKLWVVAFDPQ
jgi:hypothetical protein